MEKRRVTESSKLCQETNFPIMEFGGSGSVLWHSMGTYVKLGQIFARYHGEILHEPACMYTGKMHNYGNGDTK